MTHEPDMVKYETFDRTIEGTDSKKPWPKIPGAPKRAPRKTNHFPLRIANKDEKRSDLEVLSPLAGSTTYRTPESGRSTRHGGTGTDDLAHALGKVDDPLEQLLARALSVHTAGEWRDIYRRAFPLLLNQLQGSHNTRKLVAGTKRTRARLILHDVFHDLALERPARNTRDAAKILKIQPRHYRTLYRATAGFIETIAQAGAHMAVQKLYRRG
jgi:hypothetical protein